MLKPPLEYMEIISWSRQIVKVVYSFI